MKPLYIVVAILAILWCILGGFIAGLAILDVKCRLEHEMAIACELEALG